ASDLAIGGNSTASAKFQVFGASGNATTSGSFTFNTAGQLQTTKMQNLTLGGINTGRITLSGLNGANNGITFQGYNTGILHTDTNGTLTSSAVNLASSDVTGILPLANGGTNANLTANAGGIVYSGASALAILQSTAGNNGQCLVSGGTGTPTWQTCAAGSAGTNFWTLQNGALNTINNSTDLLVGGISTASAHFAVLNVNNNTTVASISAQNTGGSAISLDTINSSLQTANNQNFTIGGNTTGNITISPLGGATGSTLTVNALSTVVNGTLTLPNTNTLTGQTNFVQLSNGIELGGGTTTYITGAGTANLSNVYLPVSGGIGGFWQLGSNVVTPSNLASDLAIGGNSTASAKFQIFSNGNATTSGSLTFNNVTGNIQTTNMQNLNLGGSTTGRISLSGLNGANNGITFQGYSAGILHAASNGTLTSSAVNLASTDVTGVLPLANGGTNANLTANPGGVVYSGGSALATTPTGTTGQCLTSNGTSTPSWVNCALGDTTNWFTQANGALYPINNTLDFLIGGTSTASAKAAFTNINSGNPTLTLGITGSSNGYINLDSSGAGKQPGTIYEDSTGGLNISAPSGTVTVGSGTGNIVLDPGGSNLLANLSGSGNFQIQVAGSTFATFTTSSTFGIGTQNPLATIDIRSNLTTTPVASISGDTGKATFVIDQRGIGDIFTASQSGGTRFVIQRDGTIISSKYLGGIAHFNASGVLSNSAVNLASTDVTGVLPLANGGTNANLTANAGGILYSTATAFAVLAGGAGNTGQCLVSGGTGAPSWITCATGSLAPNWQLNNGDIQPLYSGVDVLIGATNNATTSAKFGFLNVNSGVPVASISANSTNNATYLTGAGNLATTNMQNLTLGGTSTGNIVLSPLNSTANGLVTVNGTLRLSGAATGYVGLTAPGTISSPYTLTLPTSLGSSSQVLGITSGSQLGWTSVATGFNPWNAQQGAIIPGSGTYDLLLGGISTTSANFAFINNTPGSGTPTASISAGTANNALYLTGAGTIGTTNMQNLTLGSSSTGIVQIGNTSINGTTTTLGYALGATVSGTLHLDTVYGISGGGLSACNTPTQKLQYDATSQRFTCGTNIGTVKSFSSSQSETVVNTDKNDYWDTNQNTPNIALSSAADAVMIQAHIEFSDPGAGSSTQNAEGARIIRSTSQYTPTSNSMCRNGAGTIQVANANTVTAPRGTQVTFPELTFTYIDATASANGTNPLYYTLCSSSTTQLNGGTPTVARIDIVLSEVAATSDVAELYPSINSNLTPGDIVTTDTSLTNGVQLATMSNDPSLIGVVSTHPSQIIGGASSGNVNGAPIALNGRIPVKITTLNGPIHTGDTITSSPFAGFGQKQTQAGYIVGKALQGTDIWNATTCTVVDSLDIANSQWPTDDGTNQNNPCFAIPTQNVPNVPITYTQPYVYVGKVMMFAHTAFAVPPITFTQAGDLTIQPDLSATDSSYMVVDGQGNVAEDDSAFHTITAGQANLGRVISQVGSFINASVSNLFSATGLNITGDATVSGQLKLNNGLALKPNTANDFATFLNASGAVMGSVNIHDGQGARFSSNNTTMAEFFRKANPTDTFSSGQVVCVDSSTGGVSACTNNTQIAGVVVDHAAFVGG
ncbi:MAG: hypothetical protein KGL95_13530, partial [Patescibacteria group bacterium]|nr:hypothetical protein [Patescibacteria group bacterium]